MCYNIVSTGSKGNCVIYHKSIMVDIGVTYKQIEPFIYDIKLILISHVHGDHLNVNTLLRICDERPTIRIGCGIHSKDMIEFIKEPDIYKPGYKYNYGEFQIKPVELYHDIPNIGFRILKQGHKIFHATDTSTLEGIKAKNYDLYALECNYDEDLIDDSIKRKTEKGQFIYENRVLNTHLSEQKAKEFYYANKGVKSKMIRLHESDNH